MPRHKIFIQKGDPAVVGVRQYQYTGKHNRVDLVHFDVAKVPQLQSAVHKYDESLPDGIAKSNHYIGTMYLNGKDCIAEHSDSADTLDNNSLITVVKLGKTLDSKKAHLNHKTSTTTVTCEPPKSTHDST